MTTDIRINWDVGLLEGDFDFDILNQDLETDEGLTTAAIISLFTDRRAKDDDQLPDPTSTDRRGWWADKVSDIEGDQIGSRLWLLEREKTVDDVVRLCKEYVKEALQWLIDDGVAVAVDVESERQGQVGNDRLAFLAKIYRSENEEIAFRFEVNWEAQASE